MGCVELKETKVLKSEPLKVKPVEKPVKPTTLELAKTKKEDKEEEKKEEEEASTTKKKGRPPKKKIEKEVVKSTD